MIHQSLDDTRLPKKVDKLLVLRLAFLKQVILVKNIFKRDVWFVEQRLERRDRREAKSPLMMGHISTKMKGGDARVRRQRTERGSARMNVWIWKHSVYTAALPACLRLGVSSRCRYRIDPDLATAGILTNMMPLRFEGSAHGLQSLIAEKIVLRGGCFEEKAERRARAYVKLSEDGVRSKR